MSRLALGTVQFGLDYGISNTLGQVHLKEAEKILKLAKEFGADTLDTAPAYGVSEKILGDIGINHFQIITKTSSLHLGVDNVVQSFYQSLEDLNIPSVDGLLVHDIGEIKDKHFDDLYYELDKLKRDKLTNKIGFSIYTPDQIDFLLDNFDFDLIQVPFNVFDNRLIDGGQLQALKDKKIEIHARSIFLQGLLLDFKNLSDYFSEWKKEFESYQEIVKVSGSSLLDYALHFALNNKEIDKVLIGVNSENQLTEIIKSTKKKCYSKAYPIYDENLLNPSKWNSS